MTKSVTSEVQQFLDRIGEAVDELEAATPDAEILLDGLYADRGLTLLKTETLRATMEAATREAAAGAPGSEPMWCVFEQMGHARYPCRLTVVEMAGQPAYRLDTPDGDGWVTTYVRPGTMYAIRPCSEDVVRRLAAHTGPPEPAHPWELKAIEPAAVATATSAARDAWRDDPEDDYEGDD